MEHAFSACCLEPHELLSVTLQASRALDVALVGWEAYQRWEKSGGNLKSAGGLASRGRRISWTVPAATPPYVMMLMLWNRGMRDVDVEIVADARRLAT
jgi:hypothetical protein